MKTIANYINEGLFDRLKKSKNVKPAEPVKPHDKSITIMFGLEQTKNSEKLLNQIIEIITNITKVNPGEDGFGTLDGEVFGSYSFDCNGVDNVEGCVDEIIQEIKKFKKTTVEITEKSSRFKRVDVEIEQYDYFQLFLLARY